MSDGLETVVLGGGCFWCTEAVFETVEGVVGITPGYAGGATPDPTYREVCTGSTGHAEAVRLDYDPAAVSLEELLEVFFSTHDPTTPDRQGNDVGTQYRSVVLYSSDDQRRRVERFIAGIGSRYDAPVVTEVKPLDTFYAAEEYHHNYYSKNPRQGYCRVVIAPKVEKARGRSERA